MRKLVKLLEKQNIEFIHSLVAILFLAGGLSFTYSLVYVAGFIFERDGASNATVIVTDDSKSSEAKLMSNSGYDLNPEVYEADEYEPAATLSYEYTQDDNGEVLGALSCVTGTSFNYEKQFSCYPDTFGDRACVQENEEDSNGDGLLDGFCIGDYVEVRVLQVWQPTVMFAGVNPDELQYEKQVAWAKNGAMAPCYDKATGRPIKGVACYNNLGSGSSPVYDYGLSSLIKMVPPTGDLVGYDYDAGSSQELQDEFDNKINNEPDSISYYRLAVSGGDNRQSGTFLFQFDSEEDGNVPVYQSDNPTRTLSGGNSPAVATVIEDKRIGSPLSSPFENTSRVEVINECSGKPNKLLDSAILLSTDPQYSQPVKCLTPKESEEDIIQMSLEKKALAWIKCKFYPNGDDCKYSVSSALEVQSPYGTAYGCVDNMCPSRNYDQQIAYRVDPFDQNLNVPGIDNTTDKPLYSMQYVTTRCDIQTRDFSKSPFPRWETKSVKCAYNMPHARQLENLNLSTMFMYPDDPYTWLGDAIEEAANTSIWVIGDSGNL